MYLRAAKTEAEDAGESTEGMASSVSELREELLKLTNGKVDIQLDDDTFKSTYQILKELSEVWDSLTDITQANITEMVGGKRNANVVSALLENFSIAEQALETSAGAAGSAMAENEKYLDSVQGKIDVMKASFEALSANFMSGDLLKFFVELATGALNLVNGILEIVDALGGLKTVLVAVSGIVLAMKLESFKSLFKTLGSSILSIGGHITSFAGKMKDLPTAMRIAKSEGKGLSAALDLVGISATTAQIAIAAITAAITIAVAAYSHWRQKVEQQRQEALDAAQASAEEADNIMDLYSAYQTASAAYESNTGSKDALTSATDELLAALGIERGEIESLAGEYGNLDDAINKVTGDALAKATSDAKSGLNAAYDNLQDAFGNGDDWGTNIAKHFGLGKGETLFSWQESSEKFNQKIAELLKNAGLENDLSIGTTGSVMFIDTDSVDEVLESYENLIHARDVLQENLTKDEYNESDAVDKIEGKISDFELVISEYLDARKLLNKSLAKQDLFNEFSENGLPETYVELEELKSKLVNNAENNKAYSINTSSNNAITSVKEYAEAYESLLNEQQKLTEWGLTEFGDVFDRSGDSFIQSTFGNIDMDKRTIITWSDELKKTYADALSSWDYEPEVGSIDTVFGGSARFGENVLETGVEVAFTPIMNIDGKTTFLDKDTVYEYIESLVGEATTNGELSTDKLFNLDAQGREVGGVFVQGLLAAVDESLDYENNGNWAETAGRLMHFSGEYGSVALAYKDITEAANEAGVSTEEFISAFGDDNHNELVSAFDDALMDLSEVFPELSEVMNQSVDTVNAVSENYALAAGQITQSAEQATESAKNLISGISAAQDTVNSQQTGKSVSLADFSSDELVEYRSALEYVNGTMQLNAEKVKEIAQAKADEQVAINNTNKALEQTKYLENAKQIEKYREQLRNSSYAEGESAESIQESIDALLSENSAIAATCDQYDLLSASIQEAVGAYQNWLNAQSASDYGDMADDAVSAIQRIRDTYDQNSDIYGDYGSKKFDAAVEFIVPDSVSADDLDAIEKYMADFKKYLTFDDDGVVEGLDIDKFLNDSVNAGLMSYSDDDGFKVLGGKKMEDFAEGLNLSSGVVQAFFDELQLKGGEFSWVDEADKTIGDLAVSANVAAENLRALHSDMAITLDVTDLETAEEKTEALDATIKQMQDLKTTVDVDAEEVEYANSIISYCITQKQQLNEPAILNVDVSKVSETTSEAVSLVQEFQRACNDLELKKALGLDTTDAQSKVDELYAKISSSENDALLALKLDTTSVETVKSSIANLDIEDIKTSLQIDDTALLDYQAEDKDATVTYHLNSTEVDGYNPKNLSRSVTYYVKTVGGVKLNGTANFAGTSYAGGTAKAGGDWGTAPGGQTLVGELGREIVVDPHTGQWYTVGDNGAEFRDIPAGAIVFNHKQTESLLANGYVAGRASALVSGTALVTGGYKPHKASSSSTTRKSSSSKKSSSSSSKSNSSTKSSDDKDDSEIIDWIEIAIDRIERAIDRLATVATSPFRKLAERINATNDELSQMSYELSLQQSAYDRYMQQANSVGLSSDLASKVQNGTIDITEYDGDTADKIKDYQEWYEKALDCKDAILELSESIAELYQNKFDDVATDYENKLSLLEHVTNAYNNGIDDLEERGYLASTKYYEALSNVEKQNIDIQKQELAALTKAMSEAVNSGSIKEGSEAWYEFQQQINEVKESIQESETSLVEFANTIREIKWERFDYLQEQISNITEEADFLIDLMENSDLYTDNGQLTDTGMATMGLHGQNYNVYMAQADKYAEELLALNKEIAEDPNNTKLLERREELLESQRDSILAAEDEKQAIIDMVREGIELELDSLRELIDTYTESLDSAKDLYDYQKKVKQQTAEIASLQKQLSAYSGDTSEETRATMQKLQVDLSDAMESLEETQYDHYISEQKKLLDNLYDEYEMILNERLDNVDALLSDMIDSINTNSASISDTLLTQAEKVGYTISENEKAIWSNEGGANSIITKYGEAFNAQMTTVNDVISKIAIKIGAMATESDKKAETTIKETTPSTKTDTTVKPQTTTNTKNNNTNTNSTRFNEDVKRGVAAAIWIYGSKSGWGNDPDRNKKLTAKFGATNAKAVQSYINAHANNGDLYKYWVSTGRSKLSQYYYSAFKKGGLADYTGVAWLDGTPQEPEMVLNPEDTKNFIALKDAMRSVADGDSPLSELFGNGDSSSNILQQLAKIESPMTASGTNVGDITYQITIPIDHVQDYNDFMNQMRKDGKFEKFIKSVTVDRLTGGSKIAKNKYQW